MELSEAEIQVLIILVELEEPIETPNSRYLYSIRKP